jgi:hypothetical protein
MGVRKALAFARSKADIMRTPLNAAGAFIEFYSGTPPATADTALSGNTILCNITLLANSFANQSDIEGLFSNTVQLPDSTAAVAGTASFLRVYTSAAKTTTIFQDVAPSIASAANEPGGGTDITGGVVLAAGTKIQYAIGQFTYRG